MHTHAYTHIHCEQQEVKLGTLYVNMWAGLEKYEKRVKEACGPPHICKHLSPLEETVSDKRGWDIAPWCRLSATKNRSHCMSVEPSVVGDRCRQPYAELFR